jgi:hypothetical protein
MKPEDLIGLSDAERAAIEEDEDEIVTDEPEEEAPEQPEEPEVEPAAEEEPAPEEPPQADFVPQWQSDAPEGLDAKLAELADQRKALRTQYQDGDIDFDTFESQRDEIDQQAQTLRDAALKAQIAAEYTEQTQKQRWQWEQEQFFGQEANKVFRSSRALEAALDAEVKALANDSANDGKPMGWSLVEGARKVRESVGMLAPKPAPQVPTQKAKPRNIPPNLGDLPSAELPDTGNENEFAHLDKLKGMALENAVARLSPADRERYERG